MLVGGDGSEWMFYFSEVEHGGSSGLSSFFYVLFSVFFFGFFFLTAMTLGAIPRRDEKGERVRPCLDRSIESADGDICRR